MAAGCGVSVHVRLASGLAGGFGPRARNMSAWPRRAAPQPRAPRAAAHVVAMAVALAVRPVAALARPSAAGARARGGRRDRAPRRRCARAAVAAPAEGGAGAPRLRPQAAGRAWRPGARGPDVSLAMVPEALAFTFVAGVPPLVGLHAAAVCARAALWCATGVISGAAGARPSCPLVASRPRVPLLPLCSLVPCRWLQGWRAWASSSGLCPRPS